MRAYGLTAIPIRIDRLYLDRTHNMLWRLNKLKLDVRSDLLMLKI